MLKEIKEKQDKIDLAHKSLKELNELNEPSFFNELFQSKKLEEHEEVLEALCKVRQDIMHLREELADTMITNRDNLNYDVRIEMAKAYSKYGIFDLVKEITSEDLLLDFFIKKIEITKGKIIGGFYD